jgi:hypothetical protein
MAKSHSNFDFPTAVAIAEGLLNPPDSTTPTFIHPESLWELLDQQGQKPSDHMVRSKLVVEAGAVYVEDSSGNKSYVHVQWVNAAAMEIANSTDSKGIGKDEFWGRMQKQGLYPDNWRSRGRLIMHLFRKSEGGNRYIPKRFFKPEKPKKSAKSKQKKQPKRTAQAPAPLLTSGPLSWEQVLAELTRIESLQEELVHLIARADQVKVTLSQIRANAKGAAELAKSLGVGDFGPIIGPHLTLVGLAVKGLGLEEIYALLETKPLPAKAVTNQAARTPRGRSYGVHTLLLPFIRTLSREDCPTQLVATLGMTWPQGWQEKVIQTIKGKPNVTLVQDLGPKGATFKPGSRFYHALGSGLLKLRRIIDNEVPEDKEPKEVVLTLAIEVEDHWDRIVQIVTGWGLDLSQFNGVDDEL